MTAYHHILVETLENGVYMAKATPTGGAGSNSGIVDLGDQTVIFDTTATLSAARELMAASQDLTGRTPRYVINSHSHPDHVHGNKVFSETSVLISSTVTRNEISLNGVESMANMLNDISTQIASFRDRLAGGVESSESIDLQEAIIFFEGVLTGYPTPGDLRIPNLTYDREIQFHGTERSARLLTFGGAHSACDAVLWLPEDGVMFAGDVIGEPILCLGHPENWSRILDSLEALGAKKIVPGHGEMYSADKAFEVTRRHLNFLFGFAEQAMNSIHPLNFTESVEVPSGYGGYWFRKDLRFLVEHLLNGNHL